MSYNKGNKNNNNQLPSQLPPRMQSGTAMPVGLSQISPTAQVLIICYLAIFCRRSLVEAYLYEYHHTPEVRRNEAFEIGVQAISRATKFNLLSEDGLGARLKPLIELTIEHDGMVTPEDHNNDHYAMRAAEIFPEIQRVFKLGGVPLATAMSVKYATAFMNDPSLLEDEDEPDDVNSDDADMNTDADDDDGADSENDNNDSKDDMDNDSTSDDTSDNNTSANDISITSYNSHDENGPPDDGNCHCTLCKNLDESATIDLTAVVPSDPFQQMAIEWAKKMDAVAFE